jgi:hypothetical protein
MSRYQIINLHCSICRIQRITVCLASPPNIFFSSQMLIIDWSITYCDVTPDKRIPQNVCIKCLILFSNFHNVLWYIYKQTINFSVPHILINESSSYTWRRSVHFRVNQQESWFSTIEIDYLHISDFNSKIIPFTGFIFLYREKKDPLSCKVQWK